MNYRNPFRGLPQPQAMQAARSVLNDVVKAGTEAGYWEPMKDQPVDPERAWVHDPAGLRFELYVFPTGLGKAPAVGMTLAPGVAPGARVTPHEAAWDIQDREQEVPDVYENASHEPAVIAQRLHEALVQDAYARMLAKQVLVNLAVMIQERQYLTEQAKKLAELGFQRDMILIDHDGFFLMMDHPELGLEVKADLHGVRQVAFKKPALPPDMLGKLLEAIRG
ncbi:hypothetical protein IS481_12155 [Caldimonas thermodepolymerans]|uniref:Uncharacterized protein n=1 Tax=Caldimonas thermodepolymerans TaxID=215580 RepID=A0A2S5T906_9BURK|nr:hypothetical protein [Caldimonas thermodepolymerans]PPE71495.1 hypothetical protein C1702_00380 [Caldimonas thermodepolymerans]QPC30523.1 hypothetical protein IS481_12155 [Caldimonas thermodepolymerans]RDI02888.1 hypothetical protein DES46_102316 [Caldimonas thermodepolymerans]